MLHLDHAVVLGLLALAPNDVAKRPEPIIAVAPMATIGDPENMVRVDAATIETAIMQGLARGEIELERLEGDCKTSACWIDQANQRGHERVLLPTLESIGPDYHVRIEAVDAATGKLLASIEDTCEICGEDEVGVVASDAAAGLLSRLSRLEQTELYTASPREQEPLEVDVEPPPPPLPPIAPQRPPDHRKALLATGASLAAVGLVGVGTGAGLFALDGRPYRQGCGPDVVDVNGRCPRMYEASAPAVAMVVVGGAAIVAGVALLVHVLRRDRARSTGIAVRPSVSGLTLGLRLPPLRNRRIGR